VRASPRTPSLLEDLGHHVEIFDLKPLAQHTWEAFDDVWAVLAAEGVGAGRYLLGREPQPGDIEPLTWVLYERARNLDALSYRSWFAEIQRVAREVVTSTLAYAALLPHVG
jgi:amidase